MTFLPRVLRHALPALALSLALPGALAAQLISLKTIPVATGDQFLLFPSENLGLAGVSISLEDRLFDPFVNPAKGGRLRGSQIFGSPTLYDVSGGNGAARSLPLGALFGSDRGWFGGMALSLQQLQAAERSNVIWAVAEPANDGLVVNDVWWPGPQQRLSDQSAGNLYAFGMLGKQLPERRLSVGGSMFLAGLDAVDGVDLLYAGSQSIEQSGSMVDLRLGLTGELDGDQKYEALLLFNRFNAEHDVTYMNWRWDPVSRRSTPIRRDETNLDRTRTYGLHFGYTRPLDETGWRGGAIFTVNRKSHPKIPNYEIMNIPRDPGFSWAYNFGVGVSRDEGPARVGIDVVYEPIWSSTWADAEGPILTRTGKTIPKGGKTVENDFRFSNAVFRVGLGRDGDRAGFQLGLQTRYISYELDQWNAVLESNRNQEESWFEWMPSWGANLKFPEFELRYVGRVTTGTGRPGIAWGGGVAATSGARDLASDFIVAPSGPLTLQEAHVFTNQVSVTVPLGKKSRRD